MSRTPSDELSPELSGTTLTPKAVTPAAPPSGSIELRGAVDEEARFVELMGVVARAPHEEGFDPPLGLETRMIAFIEGAAAAREDRPFRVLGGWSFKAWTWTAAASLAAALTVFLAITLPGEPRDGEASQRGALAGDAGGATQGANGEPRSALATSAGAPSPHVPDGGPAMGSATASASNESPVVWVLRSGQDWRSRKSAAEALSAATHTLSDPEEATLGAALGGDPDWRVRETALQALERRKTKAALSAIARATEDPYLPIRLAAVRALGVGLTPGETTDALLRRLDRDPDWRVREASLGHLLRTADGARAASMALADRHRKLREQARAALAALR